MYLLKTILFYQVQTRFYDSARKRPLDVACISLNPATESLVSGPEEQKLDDKYFADLYFLLFQPQCHRYWPEEQQPIVTYRIYEVEFTAYFCIECSVMTFLT